MFKWEKVNFLPTFDVIIWNSDTEMQKWGIQKELHRDKLKGSI